MVYISSKLGNMFGIIDTKTGVEKFYTYNEVLLLQENGIVINDINKVLCDFENRSISHSSAITYYVIGYTLVDRIYTFTVLDSGFNRIVVGTDFLILNKDSIYGVTETADSIEISLVSLEDFKLFVNGFIKVLKNIKSDVSNSCCIYRYRDSITDEVLYIGKTINLEKRIKAHSRGDFYNLKNYIIDILHCAEDELDLLELYLIGFYKPKYNKAAVRVNVNKFKLIVQLDWRYYCSDKDLVKASNTSIVQGSKLGKRKCRAINVDTYNKIENLIINGYTDRDGCVRKPNCKVALAIAIVKCTDMNLSLLRLLERKDIIVKGNEYYISIQGKLFLLDSYAHRLIDYLGILNRHNNSKIFDITVRQVERYLQFAVTHLGLQNVGLISFKYLHRVLAHFTV